MKSENNKDREGYRKTQIVCFTCVSIVVLILIAILIIFNSTKISFWSFCGILFLLLIIAEIIDEIGK